MASVMSMTSFLEACVLIDGCCNIYGNPEISEPCLLEAIATVFWCLCCRALRQVLCQ